MSEPKPNLYRIAIIAFLLAFAFSLGAILGVQTAEPPPVREPDLQVGDRIRKRAPNVADASAFDAVCLVGKDGLVILYERAR